MGEKIMKILKLGINQGMIAVIQCRIFCLPV
jgi:hypothetical protein